MSQQLISEYLKYPCPFNLNNADWQDLAYTYHKLDDAKRSALLNALAAHSGVSLVKLTEAISLLGEIKTTCAARELILSELQSAQSTATSTIELFQNRTAIKNINCTALGITRTEWLGVIAKFTKQQGRNLTPVFFLSQLSIIRKVPYDVLKQTLSRPQPQRGVKKVYEEEESLSGKRRKQGYLEDDGSNPLILNVEDGNKDLHDKLQELGVRITPLAPATPTPSNPRAARTPGQTLVRALVDVNSNTFFKPVTPQGNREIKGRALFQNVSKEQLETALPRFQFIQPGPIEFTATLELLNERIGIERRQGQKSIKKVSCADVFNAYGVQIQAADKRHFHWSHLIGYFLGGDHDTSNLIPSTAAANYNILEEIELFIEKILKSNATNQIKILVTPTYNSEEATPDLLTYSLEWTEQGELRNNTFYIHPKSFYRFTKSTHESIKVLREENTENSQPVPKF